MSDFADLGSDREELDRDAAIKAARKPDSSVIPILDCMNCSGIDQDTARVVCAYYGECVQDWDKRRKAAIRNGSGQ